eukprot:gene17227-12319_t
MDVSDAVLVSANPVHLDRQSRIALGSVQADDVEAPSQAAAVEKTATLAATPVAAMTVTLAKPLHSSGCHPLSVLPSMCFPSSLF